MFRPRRTSSPSRTGTGSLSRVSASAANTSATSTLSTTPLPPELLSLTPSEVNFIDAVLKRAGAGASTFMQALNAYNEELKIQGTSARDETVLYGKLLKLHSMRGRTWADKWAGLRARSQTVPTTSATAPTPVKPTPSSRPPRASPIQKAPTAHTRSNNKHVFPSHPYRRDPDTFTLHSHDDPSSSDPDNSDPEPENELDAENLTPRAGPSRLPFTRRAPSPAASALSNSLGLDTGPLDTLPSRARPVANQRKPQLWESISDSDGPHYENEDPVSSSYYKRNPPIPPRQRLTSDPKTKPTWTQHQTDDTTRLGLAAPTSSHRLLEKAREVRKDTVNEQDAWAKIKAERDEEDAELYYTEKLMERCWGVWRENLAWVINTQAQISQARETLVLRRVMQKWRETTHARVDLHERVAALADARLLRRVAMQWTNQLGERRQLRWRSEMRGRMKAVRKARERRVLVQAWERWKEGLRGAEAEGVYERRLMGRVWERWKEGLGRVGRMELVAGRFEEGLEGRAMERCWERWKSVMEMRQREMVLVQRVDVRIMQGVWDAWKKRMRNYKLASEFYDIVCMKHAIRSWQGSQARIRRLERKADKHMSRQDDVLLLAIVRVWRAHERGKLLERVRSARTLHSFLDVWRQKLLRVDQQAQLAQAFAFRPGSATVGQALRKWKEVAMARQRQLRLAAKACEAKQLQGVLSVWRTKVLENRKRERQARSVGKYLVLRRCVAKWRQVALERQREAMLLGQRRKKVGKIFEAWRAKAMRKRQLGSAEDAIRQMINTRTLRMALTKWTNRVIELKLRELEIVQRSEQVLLISSYKRWRSITARRAESLSLLESYMDVKREETARRIFHKWLNTVRNKRHLRAVLEEKEHEVRLNRLAVAWDQWRERFKDGRLQIIEREVQIQMQRNLVFRSFGIWRAKTNSLPAIRFDARRLKATFYSKWRSAMPRALQAKSAREAHAHKVTATFFARWLDKHRKKVALKAVARARYLRLPTVSPKDIQAASSSARPLGLALSRPSTAVPVGGEARPSRVATHVSRPVRRPLGNAVLAPSSAPSVISVPDETILEPNTTITPRYSGASSRTNQSSVSQLGLSGGGGSGGGSGGVPARVTAMPLTARSRFTNASTPSPRPRLFASRDPSPSRPGSVMSGLGPSSVARRRTPVVSASVGDAADDSSPTKVPTMLSSPGLGGVGGLGSGGSKGEGRSRLWQEFQALQRKSQSPEGKRRGF